MFTRVHRADVSLREITIARDGKQGYTVRVTSRTGSVRRILGDFEKVSELRQDTGRVELSPASEEDGWFSLARGDLCGGCRKRLADEKARIERMCISLPYIETFNSKVIKGFVPELRSRYVFFEFRDSYVLSLWTFDVRFTHSHIMAMVHEFKFPMF